MHGHVRRARTLPPFCAPKKSDEAPLNQWPADLETQAENPRDKEKHILIVQAALPKREPDGTTGMNGECGPNHPLMMSWCPSHVSVEENEQVDGLVERAAGADIRLLATQEKKWVEKQTIRPRGRGRPIRASVGRGRYRFMKRTEDGSPATDKLHTHRRV
ncbi:hypothetical protein AX15_001996 [Amanita polypyramis BW_CC]|nr:hypothetical protein AX15_001996 [Amanita polypyramis BW_CC]